MGVSIVTVFLVLDSVRLFFLIFGLLSLKLLDQKPTLSSGIFWVNKITLFIFLGVDVTWQIQNIISVLILDFFGLPGALGFPLKFPWATARASPGAAGSAFRFCFRLEFPLVSWATALSLPLRSRSSSSPLAYLVAISIIRFRDISPVRPNFRFNSLYLTPSLKAQTA